MVDDVSANLVKNWSIRAHNFKDVIPAYIDREIDNSKRKKSDRRCEYRNKPISPSILNPSISSRSHPRVHFLSSRLSSAPSLRRESLTANSWYSENNPVCLKGGYHTKRTFSNSQLCHPYPHRRPPAFNKGTQPHVAGSLALAWARSRMLVLGGT